MGSSNTALSPALRLSTAQLKAVGGSFSLRPTSTLLSGGSLLPLRQLHLAFSRLWVFEPAPSADIPGYPDRRSIHAAAERAIGAGTCVLFANPAHSEFVASWRSRDAGVLLEYRLPEVSTNFERAVEEESGSTRRQEARSARSSGRRAAAITIGALQRAVAGADRVDLPSLLRALEQLTNANEIRGAWEVMDDIAIVDPLAEDGGEWLAAAWQPLEVAYLALSSRTRSLLEDELLRVKHRPEYLRDLRNRLSTIDQQAATIGPGMAIRRLVIRRHVFALCVSGRTARDLRRKLCSYAELAVSGTSYIDCNVGRWFRTPAPARRTEASSPASTPALACDNSSELGLPSPCSGAPHESATPAAAAAIRLAFSLVRSRRGSDLEHNAEDARAGVQLERRRRQLFGVAAGGEAWSDHGFAAVGAKMGRIRIVRPVRQVRDVS